MTSFTCVSYNMLAASLGSNTIPWVMSLSPGAVAAAEKELKNKGSSATTWKDFVRKTLSPEYTSSFHSNYSPVWPKKESIHMRSLWAAEINSAADLPLRLQQTVTVSAPNRVHWADAEGGSGEKRSAWTLRGLLSNHFGSDLGATLYQDILSTENNIFSWRTRGPKMLRKIIHFDSSSSSSSKIPTPPALVGLQEYDTEELMRADYGSSSSSSQVFREAMASRGYGGVFFNDPLGRQSLAAYFRADKFRIDAGADTYSHVLSAAEDGGSGHGVLASHDLKPGDAIADAAHCFDLNCTWHQRKRGGEDGDGGDAYEATATLLPAKQRRVAGMLRLVAKTDPGLKVWVVVAHLMTTSRDSPKSNGYPGEVRAGELAELRTHVARLVKPGEAVLFMGDFNTQPTDTAVFTGRVPAASSESKGQGPGQGQGPGPALLRFDTGFKKLGVGKAQLDWRNRQAGGAGVGGALLTDALEATHGWGEASTVLPTSVSTARSEHIDYLFYDARTLELEEAVLPATESPAPNEVEPSDHLPVGARFQWRRQQRQNAWMQPGGMMASMIAAAFAATVFMKLQAKL